MLVSITLASLRPKSSAFILVLLPVIGFKTYVHDDTYTKFDSIPSLSMVHAKNRSFTASAGFL